MLVQFLVAICYLAQHVAAQDVTPADSNNCFFWPPLPGPPANLDPSVFADNPVLEYGKPHSRPFTFMTSMAFTTIYIHQEESPKVAGFHLIRDCQRNPNSNTTTLHYWDGDIGKMNMSITNVVFLIAYECDLKRPIFMSHSFNLTRPVSLSTTSTSLTSTLTSTPTPTPPSTGTLTDLSTALPTTSSLSGASANNSSTTATLAGGIGGGVGGAILIVAAGFVIWKYKNTKHKKEHEQVHQEQRPPPAYGGFKYPEAGDGYLPGLNNGSFGTPYSHHHSHGAGNNSSPGRYYYKGDHLASGVPVSAPVSFEPVELSGEPHGRRGPVEV